ncbi:hypothetical protein B0H11DRAFT_1907564 [Mycena galericulata]|nr:hypothetical protein B0H11DRAFT_1907564 [Mycena galericulata]
MNAGFQELSRCTHTIYTIVPGPLYTPIAELTVAFLSSRRVDDDSDSEAASDSPGLGDPSESPITAAETTLLRKNAAAVHSLEVLFSQWYERCILLGYKNRGASASVLTAEEAFRFRRAMYRVMTYSARFSASAYTEEEAHEISADPDALKEIRDQRVIDWAVQDDSQGYYGVYLSAGPALILATYETRALDRLKESCPSHLSWEHIRLFTDFFIRPLAQLWISRQVSAPPDDLRHLNSILETVLSGLDTCQGCGQAEAPRLWTSATWEHLYLMSPEGYLSGNLLYNQQETDALKELLRQYEGPSAISTAMIGGIFRDVVLRRGFRQWTADGSLCGDCLEQLLDEHTYLWLHGKKIKNGWVPPHNCWPVYPPTKIARHTDEHEPQPTRRNGRHRSGNALGSDTVRTRVIATPSGGSAVCASAGPKRTPARSLARCSRSLPHGRPSTGGYTLRRLRANVTHPREPRSMAAVGAPMKRAPGWSWGVVVEVEAETVDT